MMRILKIFGALFLSSFIACTEGAAEGGKGLRRQFQSIHYFEIAESIEKFVHTARTNPKSPVVVVPIAYCCATLLLAGLVWFIFYVDGMDRHPDVPVEDPDEYKGTEEDFSYEELLKQSKNPEAGKDAILHGFTEKYVWHQTLREIDMFIPLEGEDKVSRKDIKVDIKNTKITIQIAGETYLQGEFFEDVDHEECNWQIEWAEDDEKKKSRELWVNLVKKEPSQKVHNMWKSLIKGDPEMQVPKKKVREREVYGSSQSPDLVLPSILFSVPCHRHIILTMTNLSMSLSLLLWRWTLTTRTP